MTAHEARQVALLAVVQPYVDMAAKRIGDRLHDARAHAERAITAVAVGADPGRATLRKLESGRSQSAALARLDELLVDLVGPSVDSRKGIVRDAWADAYRDGRAHWRAVLDPSILAPRHAEPSRADLARARTIVVLGYGAREYLAPAVDGVGRRLRAILATASNRGWSEGAREDHLSDWSTTAAKSLTVRTAQLIRTGAFHLERVSGRDSIRPDLLLDDPTLPE